MDSYFHLKHWRGGPFFPRAARRPRECRASDDGAALAAGARVTPLIQGSTSMHKHLKIKQGGREVQINDRVKSGFLKCCPGSEKLQ